MRFSKINAQLGELHSLTIGKMQLPAVTDRDMKRHQTRKDNKKRKKRPMSDGDGISQGEKYRGVGLGMNRLEDLNQKKRRKWGTSVMACLRVTSWDKKGGSSDTSAFLYS